MSIDNKKIETFRAKLAKHIEKENPEQYSDDTIINDIVYFLGVSVNPDKYTAAQGYDIFKQEVLKALTNK